jgi:hypothetical protein
MGWIVKHRAATLVWLNNFYGLHAVIGGKVLFDGVPHTIVGGAKAGPYLGITPDAGGREISVHPTWEMVYLPAEPTEESVAR